MPTALPAQNTKTFPLPQDLQRPLLRFDPYRGELILGEQDNANALWSAVLPSSSEEVDTLVWSPLYVGEELPELALMGFGESGSITYLDGNMLHEAERLGDEILPVEGGSPLIFELPSQTPLTRLAPSNEKDSFLVAGIEVGKGFTYDLVTKKWGNLPFNSGETDSYRVIVSQCVEVAGKRYLLFSSDMPGGYGGLDVYAAQVTIVQRKRNRDRSLRFGSPINLGGNVNTVGEDFDPSYDGEAEKFYYLRRLEDGTFLCVADFEIGL